ncbi:MAG: hypothetical protein IPM69_07180 [Ignavibacteria bacterium]|nr:hypothetical protein [Ignavibacteria bacterium]
MKRIVSLLCLTLVIGFTVQSCSVRIGDFTAISTKNVDIGSKYVRTGSFEGDHSVWLLLSAIPLGGIPDLKTAVDRCLEAGGGEFATNVVLTQHQLPLILISKVGYGVKADVWKKATTGDLYNPNIEIYNLAVNADGSRELVSTKNQENRFAIYNGMNATFESH